MLLLKVVLPMMAFWLKYDALIHANHTHKHLTKLNLIFKRPNETIRQADNRQLYDKLNQQLENNANLWHQSMNHTAAVGNNLVTVTQISNLIQPESLKLDQNKNVNEGFHVDDSEDADDDEAIAGLSKQPACASSGKHYCSYKEDYPNEIVSKIVKYYRYPLESMFNELQKQVMPTIAKENAGGLVCDSVTQLIRVGWAMNTNGRWVVALNTPQYQQHVTEVICRYQSGAKCNYIPPCYRATCLQRYNTQKLLVIDPRVPHKGPFLSEFLFPSCCVCHLDNEKPFANESSIYASKK